MSDRKNSLSKKSIKRLIILGIILFFGTGTAGGIQMYRQNLQIYKDAATSYSTMLNYQILQVDIDQILRHEKEICTIQEKIESYIYGDNPPFESYEQFFEGVDKETEEAYSRWIEVDTFVSGFGNICADIRYAYVVIPSEEDLTYVWDSEVSDRKMTVPFEHLPYTGKEKEHILSVMNGEKVDEFFTENVEGELLGTSLCPIWDEKMNIVAVAAIDISISSIRSAFLKLLLHIAIAMILIMMVSITVYHYVVRKQIINPIVALTRAADNLVSNLRKDRKEPFHIDVNTGDEIDVLARSFEQMDAQLVSYIQENAAITAEKERIGTELSLATRIQADMLPNIFPPFPGRTEIDLYASMTPAKEVGGDFYDYFMIDEDHLGLVIADVSGKGIPAALFMMMSKIMVQNFALTLGGPAVVLEKVNNQICRNTGEEMFVTVWLGVLDLRTGVLTAANAGHEYPILKTPTGDFELIKDKHGLVIGGLEGYHYKEYQMQLEPGSRLFLYTDGLPEATNSENEMFGIPGTLKALNEVKDEPPKKVLEHVTRAAAAFVGDAPQFDDTTMLCLDYYGTDLYPAND